MNDYNDYVSKPKEISSGSLSPFTFLLVTLLLTLFGLLMLYSSSYPEAIMHGLPHYYYASRQVVFALLGLAAAVILYFVPEKLIKAAACPLLVLSLVFMLLTLFSPYGVTVLGARRWLELPHLPSFQSSEIVKLAMIIFLSLWFSDARAKKYIGWYYLVPIALVLLFALLILAGRAYTTTILFLLTMLVMFYAAGINFKWIIIALLFLSVPSFYLLLSESYRVKRVASFIFPSLDPQGLNWQVNMSTAAIAEGGFLGKGIGNGEYKLGLLPEVQNDFILASISEEIGLLGLLSIFALFILFAILGVRASIRIRMSDKFFSNLALGITAMIIFQVIINVAVVTGIFPPTGIPLPFFSQGGTNLFIIIAECGILYRIIVKSSRLKRRENEEKS